MGQPRTSLLAHTNTLMQESASDSDCLRRLAPRDIVVQSKHLRQGNRLLVARRTICSEFLIIP
jgi:hypothetical protein